MRNYLEYAEDGYSLLEILPKVIGFSLIDSKGVDIKAKVKVLRTMQFTNDRINYEMLIPDITLLRKIGIFNDKYLMCKKYKNHDLFSIPDNEYSILELLAISNFALQHQISVAVGVVDFDSNCEETSNVLKVIIEHFHKSCRSEDFLGCTCENKVLSILFNCNTENTLKVIDHRIHPAIDKQLLKQKLPCVSVLYGSKVQKLAAQYKI